MWIACYFTLFMILKKAKGLRKTISGMFSTGIALSLSYLAFIAILAKCIMGLLWRRIPYATSHSREQLLSGLEIRKYKYVCQNITTKKKQSPQTCFLAINLSIVLNNIWFSNWWRTVPPMQEAISEFPRASVSKRG